MFSVPAIVSTNATLVFYYWPVARFFCGSYAWMRGTTDFWESTVTRSPVDLKSEIPYQFISNSLQGDIWLVHYSELSLGDLRHLILLWRFAAFPMEGCKGKDGTRQVRDWDTEGFAQQRTKSQVIAKRSWKLGVLYFSFWSETWGISGSSILGMQYTSELMVFSLFPWIVQRHHSDVSASENAKHVAESPQM